MLLRDYFHSAHIDCFAYLPADSLPVIHPHLLRSLPDVRTVLFAAIPYHLSGETSNLAMFARGRDYHVFARSLGEGASAILQTNHPRARSAAFADHSPYNEVAGAAMAGLGVLGDNGLLITEPYSSFVFIFEFLTTLSPAEMEAEGIPRGDGVIRQCEHCGACAAACPGGCIGRDRSTCLSAIGQKKGNWSEAEIRLFRSGKYAWGCDVCQTVCPHTRRAIRAGTIDTPIPYFKENRLLTLTPEGVETMDDEIYAAYAFGWRPKEVMLRNLRVMEDKND